MSARHSSLHAKFTATFPQEVTESWKAEILAWEKDPSKPNPYDDGEGQCKLNCIDSPVIPHDTLFR